MSELDIRWESFEYHTENIQVTFEDMCRRLFTAKYLKNTVTPHTDPNLPGIEVLPVLEPERDDRKARQRISFQSKYTKNTENENSKYGQFIESAKKTVKYHAGNLDRVYLFSNQILSTANSKYQEILRILGSANIETVPVSGKDLLDLIAEYPDIADNFFVNKTYRYIGKGANVNHHGENEKQNNNFELLPIRRLADSLWVNWRTGCLDCNVTDEFVKAPYVSVSWHSEQSDYLPVTLSRAELRLLSVLVQGEGAVVCWDELYYRGIIMHKTMAALREGKNYALQEVNADFRKKVAVDAIQSLCTKAPPLSDIIKPADNGKGYRIVLAGTGIESVGGYFPAARGTYAALDWTQMRAIDEKCTDPSDEKAWIDEKERYQVAWLRRCYADACSTFEKRVSNAGENASTEADVFGDYTMAECYINAYASAEACSDICAMLDFVEKWLYSPTNSKRQHSSHRNNRTNGRVLVLHGQPGDGKTTFCKKAVYARSFEGWISDTPHVLRINLNPQHAGSKIYADGKMDISRLMCLVNPYEKDNSDKHYFCDLQSCEEDFDGSLVILDGYDELAGSLDGVNYENAFIELCKAVRQYAFDHEWNFIITSRTMCIEDVLKAVSELEGVEVAAFAPMTDSQQELMIERMAELEEQKGNQQEANDLREYQVNALPKLRDVEETNIGRLLAIPTLFRMIVSCRFQHIDGIESEAELYSELFYDMLGYKDQNSEERTSFLRDYEDIASRIFSYNGNAAGDTCPYGEELGRKKRKLIYFFLTKNNPQETGHLGFLHREFYQFFFASYLVSGIQGFRDFRPFFLSLRYYPIIDKDVWRLVSELIQMKRKGKDPFSNKTVEVSDIEDTLARVNNTALYSEALTSVGLFRTGTNSKKDWNALEQAVKNLFLLLSATANACSSSTPSNSAHGVDIDDEMFDKRIISIKDERGFKRYGNICALLRRGKFAGIYLENLNFTGADLTGANFINACLRNVCFKGAILTGANLYGADLRGAVLDEAKLIGTNLREADLTGATLQNAKMNNSDLREANLTNAILDLTDFTGADLSASKLNGAHLERVIMKGARLDMADLRGAELSKAHLKGAHMEGVFLEGANLTSAHMEGAYLKAAHFAGEPRNVLKGQKTVSLREAVLDDAKLKGADLNESFLLENQYLYAQKNEALGLPARMPSGMITVNNKVIDLKSSDTIEFGRYWQDRSEEGNSLKEEDKTPLSWKILRREYDKVLIITEKLIDCHVYHDDFIDVTWEGCKLRRWLNEEFFYNAFDVEERIRIVHVCNSNPDNEKRHVPGGKPTWDRVFLLNIHEARTYFPNSTSMTGQLTSYAESRFRRNEMALGEIAGWWWLRSPGYLSSFAACVAPDGVVSYSGLNVNDDIVFVRPAIWLRL